MRGLGGLRKAGSMIMSSFTEAAGKFLCVKNISDLIKVSVYSFVKES